MNELQKEKTPGELPLNQALHDESAPASTDHTGTEDSQTDAVTQELDEDGFPKVLTPEDQEKIEESKEFKEWVEKHEKETGFDDEDDEGEMEQWNTYKNSVVRKWNEEDRKKIAYADYVSKLVGEVKDKKDLYAELLARDKVRKEAESKPDIVSLSDFMSQPVEHRPQIIPGILKKKSILILVSASKVGKTWVVLDLALSVANGAPWLGFPCNVGRVLIVNFELHEDTAQERFGMVKRSKSEACECEITYDNVELWNLRGYASDVEQIANQVIDRCSDRAPYDLIILDPVYKMLGDLDENNAKDMNKMMNHFDRICTETGASIAIVGHFPKGSKAGAQTGDRMSGSGVTTRATDSLIELTPAAGEEDEPFPNLDVTGRLRDFRPLVPFVVKMENYILQRVAGAEISTGLNAKTAKSITADQYFMLTNPFDVRSIKVAEWDEMAKEKYGAGPDACKARRSDLKKAGLIEWKESTLKIGKKETKSSHWQFTEKGNAHYDKLAEKYKKDEQKQADQQGGGGAGLF